MIVLPFKKARNFLKEADVLLFRGTSFVSQILKRATSGRYSHVGIASSVGSNGGKIWECLEVREYRGGRAINLEQYLKIDGSIDVYRPANRKRIYTYNPQTKIIQGKIVKLDHKKVTNIMRRMTGLPYGWRRIAWMAQHHIPGLRWFYNIESTVDDTTKELIYPVCSTAVAYSFSANGFDLIHERSDVSTSPSDISRSPLLSPLFTITP